MNQRRSSPTATPASKPPQTPKRRGRPRSPVFGYFQRIVSESGEFQGNKCRFCPFTSRDRSENPTYLTRHILRSCDAPQEVKDAMSVRHPSIAIASFGHGGRYNVQNTGSFPTVPNPMVSTSSGRLTVPQALSQSGEPVRQIQVQLQRSQQAQSSPLPSSTAHAVSVPAAAVMDVHQREPSKKSSQPRQTGSQRSGQAGSPQTESFIVPANSSRTIIRSAGVTKSRRGRPRSPALQHFRRHIDDKGNFIANQCAHCTFVSRDRSENSTLLLRHLLSPACGTPEDVRVVLRGNRYTADGKRTNRGGKSGSAGTHRTGSKLTVGSSIDASEETSRGSRASPTSQSFSANPEVMATALVRFFVRHEIDFRAIESTLFTDVFRAVTSQANSKEEGERDKLAVYRSQQLSSTAETLLPAWNTLQAFWQRTPVSAFLGQDADSTEKFPSSKHLIIYFPDYATPFLPHNVPCGNTVDEESNPTKAPMIASTFLWTSGTRLEYVGSKNCTGDFQSCIAELVSESQLNCVQGKTAVDQVFFGRSFESIERSRDIPSNDSMNTWISDVPREIDILAQELLSQVPLLARCIRRNKLLASFFRETYSNRAAVMLFGRNLAEKEQCARYMAHIANPVHFTRCRDALENATQTYEILLHAQSSHKDRQRLQETGSFLHTISEENAGNVQLCQEITRLVLSQPYRNELRVFIAVMRPLANLMTLYNRADHMARKNDANLFSDPCRFRGRSLACLLPDCVKTLRDIYTEKTPEFDNDLRLLRGLTTCRLIGKGGDVYPPIVGEICYLAAFLNPNTNLSTVKGITVDEAWRRALSFLHMHYGSRSDVVLERAVEQLHSFHRRSGVFSVSEMFSDASEVADPRMWWEKHGSLAPDLWVVALKVLSAPTAAFAVVKHMAEVNGRQSDLRGLENELMEKRRLLHWNLLLSENAYDSRGSDPTLGSSISKV